MPLPDLTAGRDVNSIDVVGDSRDDGELARSVRRLHIRNDQRREQVVQLPRRVVELQLPRQAHALDAREVDQRLVPLPGRALNVAAVGEPAGLAGRRAAW